MIADHSFGPPDSKAAMISQHAVNYVVSGFIHGHFNQLTTHDNGS